jgi:hypothetical protein
LRNAPLRNVFLPPAARGKAHGALRTALILLFAFRLAPYALRSARFPWTVKHQIMGTGILFLHQSNRQLNFYSWYTPTAAARFPGFQIKYLTPSFFLKIWPLIKSFDFFKK